MQTRGPALIYLSMSLLAGSVLVLEVALTRVFSVLAWYHFTYMIISLALLGFGAAGSYLTGHTRRTGGPLPVERLPRFAFLYGGSLLVALVVFSSTRFDPFLAEQPMLHLAGFLMWDLLLAVPFFFAGLCLASLITAYREEIHRLYFADLLGASAGAALSVLCIRWLGATNAILLVACLGALAGVLLQVHARGRPTVAGVGIVCALAALLVVGLVVDPYLIRPAPSKMTVSPHGEALQIEYSRWHHVARVDVSRPYHSAFPAAGGDFHPRDESTIEQRVVYQDGAAPTFILSGEVPPEELPQLRGYLQSAPYALVESPSTMVIGAGGGVDVLIALHHGARHVTAVELNPLTVQMMSDEFAGFSGGLYRRDDVTLVNAEGRHFVARDSGTYDVIQLSGVDTFTALSSGAYALAENYLYTVEAIEDFWARLSPDGLLSFSRWYLAPPRETLRLTGIAVEALERQGVEHPEQHIVVIKGQFFAETLIRRSPFTPADVGALEAWCEAREFTMKYDPFHDHGAAFDPLLRADAETRGILARNYIYDIRPSTDDSPFFFNFYKWKTFREESLSRGGYLPTILPMGLLTFAATTVAILFLAVIGILAPMRRDTDVLRQGGLRAVVYFGALGLGFMLVEIALIQKVMVFLGGPAFTLAFVLFTMLFFSGFGSLLARRFRSTGPRVFGVLAGTLLVTVVLESALLHWVLPGTLSLGVVPRALIVMALLAPLALQMGMPFPLGIGVVSQRSPQWVPWAWAINSFLTVLGPLLAVVLSMQLGFQAVFLIAGGIYLLGFIAIIGLAREQARPTMAS